MTAIKFVWEHADLTGCCCAKGNTDTESVADVTESVYWSDYVASPLGDGDPCLSAEVS